MKSNKWTREETILAFDLYCRTKFSKISSTNSDIIQLANLIGRTSGAVALKMLNLAHLDPELQKKNITGMSHGSMLDVEVFNEFNKDWEELSYQAQLIRARYNKTSVFNIIEMQDLQKLPEGKNKTALMKARIGQHFFRSTVLSSYNNKCCVTGIKCSELLVASHIKPWNVSDEHTERTNPKNGLCLNSLHDKAFDRGLITLDQDYRIVVSKKLKFVDMDEKTRDWFFYYEGKQIQLPIKFLPDRQFIEYHSVNVFKYE